jgi:hyperosmotically inducible protein
MQSTSKNFLMALVVSCVVGSAFAEGANDPSNTSTTVGPSVSSKAANRQLARAARIALNKTKGLEPSNIRVTAKGSVVSLSGTVPDATQIDLASNSVKNIPNISSVSNRLTVREPGGH